MNDAKDSGGGCASPSCAAFGDEVECEGEERGKNLMGLKILEDFVFPSRCFLDGEKGRWGGGVDSEEEWMYVGNNC